MKVLVLYDSVYGNMNRSKVGKLIDEIRAQQPGFAMDEV